MPLTLKDKGKIYNSKVIISKKLLKIAGQKSGKE